MPRVCNLCHLDIRALQKHSLKTNPLDTTPKTQSSKERIDKLDFIKTKSFWSAKDNVKVMRRQAKDWEKIFVKDKTDKGQLSFIYTKYTKNFFF